MGPTNTSISGSDGSTDWSAQPWFAQVKEVSGDSKVKVKVDKDKLEVKSKNGDSGDFAWASRVVPLAGQTAAIVQLELDEDTKVKNGTVTFQARLSSASPWQTVHSFADDESAATFNGQSYDLATELGGALTDTTEIRFRADKTNNSNGENKIKLTSLTISGTGQATGGTSTSLRTDRTLVGDAASVIVTMTLTADEAVSGITPSALNIIDTEANGGGVVGDACTDPSPASGSIATGGGSIDFTYTCTIEASSVTALPAELLFAANATSLDATFATAVSNSVLIASPLTYQVTVDDPITAAPITNIASISEYGLEASEPGICYTVADNGGSGDDDAFYTINQTTGVFTRVGDLDVSNVEAITDSVDGTTTYAANGGTWGTINRTSGVFSSIGSFGTAGGSAGAISLNDVDGLAVASDGTYYGTQRRGSAEDLLFQIDPTTGAHVPNAFESSPGSGTFVDYLVIETEGVVPGNQDDIDDIAIDPVTGVMYATANGGSPNDDYLVIIDRETAVVTVVANITLSGTQLDDMEGLSYRGTQLVGTSGANSNQDDDTYFAINQTTGVATVLGGPGFPDADFESLSCPTTVTEVPGGNTIPPTDSNEVVTNTTTQSIDGTIYSDQNGNGVYDVGTDIPLPGVVVVITDSNGGVYNVTTNVNGEYSQAVAAGSTTTNVDESTLPPSSILVPIGDNTDPNTVTVPPGGSVTDNRGYLTPSLDPDFALIGDRVWYDTNLDGIQDPDEPGIFGVTVTLTGTDD